MKIVVVGTGYVGLSIATLLSQFNDVIAVDIDENKVELINKRISPIVDKEISEFFKNKDLKLIATKNDLESFEDADIIVIATPTDYNVDTNQFDTSTVDGVLKKIISVNKDVLIVIKSTIPVGYIDFAREKYQNDNIIFSPEFLREGKALYDNLYPSRIVVGEKSERAKMFANLLRDAAKKIDIERIFVNSREAESIKLFANTYLAVRVSFFNELDIYAEINHLDSHEIIRGVSSDPRIGDFYNNPSFGYGGYCLPKDTKQLVSNFGSIPNSVVSASVESNEVRKSHIVKMIKNKKPKVVGIYRLTMKKDSDNYRSSAIQDIMQMLIEDGYEVQIFEPTYNLDEFNDIKVNNDFESFAHSSSIIVANRMENQLINYMDKVYTRDIYFRD